MQKETGLNPACTRYITKISGVSRIWLRGGGGGGGAAGMGDK